MEFPEGFEWDSRKREENLKKHGIDFWDVTHFFEDPNTLEFKDDRMDYDEERRVIIGMLQAILVSVVFTERGEAIRLFSARKSTAHERKKFAEGED